MSEIVETIYNCETGEVTEVLSTPEYEAQRIIAIQREEELQQAILEEEQARATNKQAVLNQLGITEEQARLLLS